MSDEFLDEIGRVESKVKLPSPTDKQMGNPLEDVPKTEVRRATNEQGKDPSMAGQQLRRSILIPPEMDEEINRICQKYQVKKMEMMRYLIGKGLESVHGGSLDDSLVKRVVLELPTPDWRARR